MSRELNNHKKRVYEIGCIITGNPQCILHHASGGSMKDLGIHKGRSQRNSDWLIIPLIPHLHTGDEGIHTIGVKTWESIYGKQVFLLDMICNLLALNVWGKAGIERDYQKVNW